MNLFSKPVIQELLEKHGASALKSLGQHFLISRAALKKIIEAAGLNPNDNVLEIGPGIGTLTQELARKTGKVVAIEKDRKMIEILRETLKEFNNIEVIQGDALKLDPKPYTLNPYKVVANLPYYITSPVIRKFLESENPPEQMVLLIQKEVAQRICPACRPPAGEARLASQRGAAKMSLLSVSVQFYAEPKIVAYVPKESFWPKPKVDSAILKLETNGEKPEIGTDLFFKIVKAGFSQPRKQLINNLSKGLKMSKAEAEKWLVKNKIQPQQRAETLNIQDWLNLAKTSV